MFCLHPPTNSKHFGQNENDPYDELQSELMHYSKLGRIMLMGVFNARKDLLSDSLGGSINDLQFLTNSSDLISNPVSETFTKLHSLDQSVNRYGRSPVNICNLNKLTQGGTQAFFDRDARPRTNFNYPKK